MFRYLLSGIILSILFSIASFSSAAQNIHEPAVKNPDWSKSYQPFRIAGNLYYVGTYDLACYLITTTKGNILINTGLASSASQIKKNIETLGFKFADTRILLTTQVHYDHTGAMAAVKKSTGAQMMVDEKDAAVIADGGISDYAFGDGTNMLFAPVKADRLLHDGDTITLGEMQIVMLHHPGHTKGSCSFLFTVKDEQQSYKVLIANMPTIVTDARFAEVTAYPGIAADYAYTLSAMKNLSFDIWLSSHASQFSMHDKHQPGDACNPLAFADRKDYDAYLQDLQKDYDEKISQ